MYFLTAFIAPYLAAFNKKALKKPEQPGHEAAHSPPSPTMKQSAGSNKQTNQHSNHWFKRSNLNKRGVDWTGVRVETMLRCSCPLLLAGNTEAEHLQDAGFSLKLAFPFLLLIFNATRLSWSCTMVTVLHVGSS